VFTRPLRPLLSQTPDSITPISPMLCRWLHWAIGLAAGVCLRLAAARAAVILAAILFQESANRGLRWMATSPRAVQGNRGSANAGTLPATRSCNVAVCLRGIAVSDLGAEVNEFAVCTLAGDSARDGLGGLSFCVVSSAGMPPAGETTAVVCCKKLN